MAAEEQQPTAYTGKRAEYIKIQKFIPADKIAFLDETGINTRMAKPCGWGKRQGERACARRAQARSGAHPSGFP
jgi:hypothetical protein